MRRPGVPALLVALAAVLVVGGAVVVGTAEPVTFGWFAYTPVDVTVQELPWTAFWTTRTTLGAAAVVAGLLLAAVVVGYAAGRRSLTRTG